MKSMNDFAQLNSFILNLAVTGFLGWLIWELRKMREAIEKLNVQSAVVINELEYHDKRITKLEEI